jgi:hyperosmotically inducible periplasmic protein
MPSRVALVLVLLTAAVACSRTIDSTITDATITAGVKTALLNDTTIDGTRVQVRTEAGIVHLSGGVGSQQEAEYVVTLVRAVNGVREVRSSLAVGDAAYSERAREP